MKGYETMLVQSKLDNSDKAIKMKFANTAYVLTTSMTLVSSTKLIKQGFDRDMLTKTLVHVATGKKVCDIEEHFGVMTLEFNPIDESTATLENAAPFNPRDEVLNEAPKKKIEMLNNQALKKHEMLIDQAPMEKEEEKTSQSITNSDP